MPGLAGRGVLAKPSSALSYSATVLADSPTGFWMLNEASGATATNTGSTASADGTYTGSVAYRRTMGNLQGIDLTGGYVSLPDNAAWSSHAGASGTMSVGGVFLVDTLATKKLYGKGNGGGYEFELRITSGGVIEAAVYPSSGAAEIMKATSAGSTLTAGTAFHAVMTYDRGAPRIEVWVNGTSVASSTSTTASTSSDGTFPWELGRRNDNPVGTLDGGMAGICYFPTVLSSTRINAHARAAGF